MSLLPASHTFSIHTLLLIVVVCNTLGCGMCFALHYYVVALMQVGTCTNLQCSQFLSDI